MANAVRPKRSNTAASVPSAGSLAEGEIAANFVDLKIYGKDAAGNVQTLSGGLATTSAAGSVIVGSGLSVSAGTVSANVLSVAGRTGAITLSASDISGLAAVATSGSASDLTTGTLPDARLSSNVLLTSQYMTYYNFNPTWVETYPASLAVTGLAVATGNSWISFFTPLVSKTVTQIAMHSQTAASGVTFARMGLYTYNEATNALTLVARTDNDTTLFTAANTGYTRSLSATGGYPTSYNIVAGTRYGLAFAFSATTVGTQSGKLVTGAASTGALFPRTSGALAGYSDLPASGTNIISVNGNWWYIRLL